MLAWACVCTYEHVRTYAKVKCEFGQYSAPWASFFLLGTRTRIQNLAICVVAGCWMTMASWEPSHVLLLGGMLGHLATYRHTKLQLQPAALHCSLATWRMLYQPAA
jgi:hypothetical protein